MTQFMTCPRSGMMSNIDQDPVVELARKRLSESSSYAICFRDVSLHHSNGVLTMQGRLPSFYLKQILQTLLRDVDGVDQIDNQTYVSVLRDSAASATGDRNCCHSERMFAMDVPTSLTPRRRYSLMAVRRSSSRNLFLMPAGYPNYSGFKDFAIPLRRAWVVDEGIARW